MNYEENSDGSCDRESGTERLRVRDYPAVIIYWYIKK